MATSLLNLEEEKGLNTPLLFHAFPVCVLVFHTFLHSPVIAPPIKANPMDEAKAAACMAAELRFKPRVKLLLINNTRFYIYEQVLFYVIITLVFSPKPQQ